MATKTEATIDKTRDSIDDAHATCLQGILYALIRTQAKQHSSNIIIATTTTKTTNTTTTTPQTSAQLRVARSECAQFPK